MPAAPESKHAIRAALVANLAIAVTKLIAALLSSTAAPFSERGHSLVDTTNE